MNASHKKFQSFAHLGAIAALSLGLLAAMPFPPPRSSRRCGRGARAPLVKWAMGKPIPPIANPISSASPPL